MTAAYLSYPQVEGFLHTFWRKKGKDTVERVMGGNVGEIRAVHAEERLLAQDKVFVVPIVGSALATAVAIKRMLSMEYFFPRSQRESTIIINMLGMYIGGYYTRNNVIDRFNAFIFRQIIKRRTRKYYL